GCAGLLSATVRWHMLTATPIPDAARARLEQLLDCARPSGRGAAWPWRQHAEDGHDASMPGWCNGSAGVVQLCCAAHDVLSDDRLLAAAPAAAGGAGGGGAGPGGPCAGHAGPA